MPSSATGSSSARAAYCAPAGPFHDCIGRTPSSIHQPGLPSAGTYPTLSYQHHTCTYHQGVCTNLKAYAIPEP